MPSILRNILVLLVALFVGGAVNMGLIMLGPSVIPIPEGFDMTTMEGLKEAMPLLEPKNFIFPFLAHALGTLVGAFIVAKFAATHHMRLAVTVGLFFLLAGISMVMEIPGPTWYNLLDLVVAYVPMGWLGGRLAGRDFGVGREVI
ncbi:MAG: hypothetical protein ACI8YQ_004848 [Polaribacter sp.]|jgi:hypothetical protein